jgi:hypothetical protein
LIQVEGTEKKVVVKKDMLIRKIIESMTSDRIEWCKRIYVADPDYFVEDP